MPTKAPLVQLSSRGQITLPSSVRRSLGLRSGDAFQVRIVEGRVLLEPVEVTAVEIYTEDRISEFRRNAEMTDEELERARAVWDL